MRGAIEKDLLPNYKTWEDGEKTVHGGKGTELVRTEIQKINNSAQTICVT